MVSLDKLVEYLEKEAPPALAEEYDNVGLLVGDRQAKISRVLVCLDTDSRVVAEAAEKGCELILSHHPLLFHPVRRIVREDSIGNTLMELIRSGIGLYAYHTNCDAAHGGLCDYLLSRIGVSDIRHTLTDPAAREGIGRVASLGRAVTLAELMDHIKTALGLAHLRYVGDPDDLVQTIGICNGGGGDLTGDALEMGCDVYLSGDFKHHHGRMAFENNMALVELTHYDAEIIFRDMMADKLAAQFELTVIKSEADTNVWHVR